MTTCMFGIPDCKTQLFELHNSRLRRIFVIGGVKMGQRSTLSRTSTMPRTRPTHPHLVPAALTVGRVFLVSMAVCLLRAAGLGASRPLAFVARHQHACSAAGRGKAWCSWGGGGGSSASASR